MKPSALLRAAIPFLNSPDGLAGCCFALASCAFYNFAEFSDASCSAGEYLDMFRPVELEVLWFGPLLEENLGLRVTALGFAAAIAESEGN